jgi:hypothetical protein
MDRVGIEAKGVFPQSIVAKEGMEIMIDLPNPVFLQSTPPVVDRVLDYLPQS